MELQNVLPADIEKRSMEIIGEELGQIHIDEEKLDIVEYRLMLLKDLELVKEHKHS